MRPAILALIPLCFAVPALAGSPPGPDLVIEAMDQACSHFMTTGDSSGLAGDAETLGLRDIGPFYILRSASADVLLTGRNPPGEARMCRTGLDSDPAIAAPLPGRVKVWAKAHGFKPAGKPTPGVNEKGRAFVSSKWSGKAGQLEMKEFAAAPSNGRINTVIDWTATP